MNIRSRVALVALASLVAVGANPDALAQVDWTLVDTAVEPGPPGSWDAARHQAGDVVFDGTTYHMFLVGGQTDLSWESQWQVGHWTWNALTQEWDPDVNNPVLGPDPGEWDAHTIYSCSVLHDGATFHMWYGSADGYPAPIFVGYATSPDGSEWTKHPDNPVFGLEPGAPGEWNDSGMAPGTVLLEGTTYRMWLFAVKSDGAYGTWRIGHATATDPLHWTMHPDPVLEGRADWEGNHVYLPKVLPNGAGYSMWYSGLVPSQGSAIGYAVSPDGLNWGRWPGNPVLEPVAPCLVLDSSAVVVDGGTFHMWSSHCQNVNHSASQREVDFFDGFETGDTSVWTAAYP
jgi:hypothetical protein